MAEKIGLHPKLIETARLTVGGREYYSPAILAGNIGQPLQLFLGLAHQLSLPVEVIDLLPYTDQQETSQSERLGKLAAAVKEETGKTIRVLFTEELRDTAASEHTNDACATVYINLPKVLQEGWSMEVLASHEFAHFLVTHRGYQRDAVSVKLKPGLDLSGIPQQLLQMTLGRIPIAFSSVNDFCAHIVVDHLLGTGFDYLTHARTYYATLIEKNIRDFHTVGAESYSDLIEANERQFPNAFQLAIQSMDSLIRLTGFMLFAADEDKTKIIEYLGRIRKSHITPIEDIIRKHINPGDIYAPNFLKSYTPQVFRKLHDGLANYFKLKDYLAYDVEDYPDLSSPSGLLQKAKEQISGNDIWPALTTLAEILKIDPAHAEAVAEQGRIREQLLKNMESRGYKGQSAYCQLAELAERFGVETEVEYWKSRA